MPSRPTGVKTIPVGTPFPRRWRLSREQQFDPLTAKEAMDQLVALGYIDNRTKIGKSDRQHPREMRYNLARSYMNAGRTVTTQPILKDSTKPLSDQYRCAMYLSLCYRTLNEWWRCAPGRKSDHRPATGGA